MTREMRTAPSRFWADDRGLSIFLAALVATHRRPGPWTGAAAVAGGRRVGLIVSVITVAAFLVRWTNWLFPSADLARVPEKAV